MRITQSMILRNTLSSVNTNLTNLHSIQEKISTGKKVTTASDDPAAYSRVQRYRKSLKQNEQYLENINLSNDWINASSAALVELHDFAVQARDIATRGADAGTSAQARIELADLVQVALDEAVSIGNTQYGGKRLFAGTNTTNVQPFTLAAGVVTYSGNDEDINRKISQNITVAVNTTGQQLMDSNLFDSLNTLITALQANDVATIQNSIDTMSTVADDLLSISTSSASLTQNINLVESRLNDSNIRLMEYISNNEDAKLEEEIVKYKSQETAYQAALQSASQIMGLNILYYL